jgi:hypothetical protein
MRLPHLWMLLLVIALLTACTGTTGTETVNPTAEPTTATEPTAPDSDTGTEPTETPPTITPGATEVVIPTSTPVPTDIPATAEPTPAEIPELPLPPTSLMEVPDWLNTVADNGNPLEEVRSALLESEWLESEADFQAKPMKADGGEAWVVRITRPLQEGEFGNPFGLPGGVFVVDPAVGALVYEQFGQASIDIEEAFFPSPTLLPDMDFTGDMVNDLLFKLTNCGANTCYDEYHIVSYQDSDTPRDVILTTGYNYEGEIVDDLPFASMSYSEAYFGDDSGDSITDLQLVGGTQGSVGAGPQRSRSETYGWDGEHVVLLLTEYEDSPFRYFKLVDANIAFDAEDYPTARALYEEVINNEELEDLGYFADLEDERGAMTRYALYRLVILDILEEDFVGAQSRAEQMVADYPNDPIAVGALETVMSFARTGSLSEACTTFTTGVNTLEPDPVAPLDYMGYANPELGAETLCPL